MKLCLPVLALALAAAMSASLAEAQAHHAPPDLETPQRELEDVNAQHETAVALHIASTVVGVPGAGALVGALTMALSGLNSSAESTVAFLLVVGGGSLSFINFVLVIVGASLDLGSASHRRNLLAAHPELALELTPGPGDAGLGITLRF
jgi:hypothetical protein